MKQSRHLAFRKYIRERIKKYLNENEETKIPTPEEEIIAREKTLNNAKNKAHIAGLTAAEHSSAESVKASGKEEVYNNKFSEVYQKITGEPAPEEYLLSIPVPDEPEDGEIQETSNSGGISGYETPGAFSNEKNGISAKRKKVATQLGMKIVEGKKNLTESRKPVYLSDENLTPEQKMRLAMKEVKENLKFVETIVKESIKLKEENEIEANNDTNSRLYNSLKKINGKAIELMVLIKNLM